MHIQQAHIFVQLKVFDKYIFMLIRKLSHPSEIFAKVRTWSKLYSFRRKWRNSWFFENFSISSKIITHLFRLRICKRDSNASAKWRIEFRRSKNTLWYHSTRYTYSRNRFFSLFVSQNLNNERIIFGIERIQTPPTSQIMSIPIKSYSILFHRFSIWIVTDYFNYNYNYSSFQLFIIIYRKF